MSRLKVALASIAGILTIGAAAAVWVGVDMYRFAHRPAGADDSRVVVAVAPGQTFAALTASLQESQIITDARKFRWLARIQGDDERLKAGEYALSRNMTPLAVLDTLVSGDVLLHRLTIPEGYNIEQIADELTRSALGDARRFLDMARDPARAEALGVNGPSLEGYLFPDTYYFPKGVSTETIIATMVDRFKSLFSDDWRARAETLGLTPHEVVTLASIIEKETGDPAERPLIASVFHNRLEKRMRLESDPTVIYGIEDYDGNITRRHLRTATPYNTYVIRGLPPGPIANPGAAALEAALYPDQSDYLFFVSKKDGTHYFSKTIQEHTRAVRKYQLRR